MRNKVSICLLASLMISSAGNAHILKFNCFSEERPEAPQYSKNYTNPPQAEPSPLERKNASHNLNALHGQQCAEALQQARKAVFRTPKKLDPIALKEAQGTNDKLRTRLIELRRNLNISNVQDLPEAEQLNVMELYGRTRTNMAAQPCDRNFGSSLEETEADQYHVIHDRISVLRETINTNDKIDTHTRLKAYYTLADILERNPSIEAGKAGLLESFYAYYNIANSSFSSDYTVPAIGGMMRTLGKIIDGNRAAPIAVPLAYQMRAVNLADEYGKYFPTKLPNVAAFKSKVIDRNIKVTPVAARGASREKAIDIALRRSPTNNRKR